MIYASAADTSDAAYADAVDAADAANAVDAADAADARAADSAENNSRTISNPSYTCVKPVWGTGHFFSYKDHFFTSLVSIHIALRCVNM